MQASTNLNKHFRGKPAFKYILVVLHLTHYTTKEI